MGMPAALQQRLLNLVSRAGVILGSPRIEDVLPGILTVARETVAADGYAVWRIDPGRDAWVVVGHAGVSDDFAAAIISSFQGQPVAPVPQVVPVAAEDVLQLPMLDHRRDAYLMEGTASILAIPLLIDGEASATLVFYYRRR